MKKRLIQVMIMFTLLLTMAFSADAADSSYYDEDYRPQYHFTPEANWMNDPNGMVYYAGNITCSINTIHTGFSGDPCIGGMPSAKIWLHGNTFLLRCIRMKKARSFLEAQL